MILPAVLISILSIFVFYCIIKMIKRGHDLHAMAFFVLYVYTIFAQIGYSYFPDLSKLIGAYFGEELFYYYWLFVFLSFVVTFIIYCFTNPLNYDKIVYKIKPSVNRNKRILFYLITIVLYIILNIFFINNRSMFGWGGGMPMGTVWFVLGFRIFTICTFLLYTLFRNTINTFNLRVFSFFLFLMCFVFFLSVAIAAGTRSDILYFFIAVSIFECFPVINTIRNNKKKILSIVFVGFFVIQFLMTLLSLRTQSSTTSFSSFLNTETESVSTSEELASTKLLFQDYYAPSHTLFISMQYGVIDPLDTFLSNISNSFILIKYPFLTNTIVSKIGYNFERAEGWSYHLFVEGYNAFGWLGIIYNGIFWNLGLAFWCLLARSNNNYHNKIIISILFFLIVNTMRSQTCAFIQSFWMILLPSLFLLLLSSNSSIVFIKSTNKTT